MRTSFARILATTATVFGLLGVSLLSAAPAHAKIVDQCTGVIKKTHTIQGHGRVEVWYSPKNGGTNCVMLYDLKPGPRYMGVIIRSVNYAKLAEDTGTFEYYAGGARISGMDGKCVVVDAFIRVSGPQSFKYGNWGPYLCN